MFTFLKVKKEKRKDRLRLQEMEEVISRQDYASTVKEARLARRKTYRFNVCFCGARTPPQKPLSQEYPLDPPRVPIASYRYIPETLNP